MLCSCCYFAIAWKLFQRLNSHVKLCVCYILTDLIPRDFNQRDHNQFIVYLNNHTLIADTKQIHETPSKINKNDNYISHLVPKKMNQKLN